MAGDSLLVKSSGLPSALNSRAESHGPGWGGGSGYVRNAEANPDEDASIWRRRIEARDGGRDFSSNRSQDFRPNALCGRA